MLHHTLEIPLPEDDDNNWNELVPVHTPEDDGEDGDAALQVRFSEGDGEDLDPALCVPLPGDDGEDSDLALWIPLPEDDVPEDVGDGNSSAIEKLEMDGVEGLCMSIVHLVHSRT